MGRRSFSRDEIDQLRRLIREKQTADRTRQKTLRSRMRAIGFYISDFSTDSAGFVVSDLDDLVSRGVITITDVAADALSPTRTAAPRASSTTAPSTHAEAATLARSRSAAPARTSDESLDSLVREALRALAVECRRPIAEAGEKVPRRPGLYAIHAPREVWFELGLGEPPDERPLYVGKAEASLVSRDLDTHFGDGRTGSSTVRRSFAALLREPLQLEGRPRNPAKPERPANYGLSPEHDRRLTTWMCEYLALAVWAKPSDCEHPLSTIEKQLLFKLQPPLNLKDVVTPWTAQLKAARKKMSDQARARMGAH
jgi:hypothetical protein